MNWFSTTSLLHLIIVFDKSWSLKIRWSVFGFVFFTRDNIVIKFFTILFGLLWLFTIRLFFRDRKRLNNDVLILLLHKSRTLVALRKMGEDIITLFLICCTLLSEAHNCIRSRVYCVITTHWVIDMNLVLLTTFIRTWNYVWNFKIKIFQEHFGHSKTYFIFPLF